MGTEIDVSDFSLGSRLRTTAHDTGMATWARLSPDLGSRKASDAAYAVGHALSDAMDVLKAAVLLTVAAELDRISPELTSAVCSKTDEWDAGWWAALEWVGQQLGRRASELRGEG